MDSSAFTIHICSVKVIELKNASADKHGTDAGWQCEVFLGHQTTDEGNFLAQVGLTEISYKNPPFWSEEIFSQIADGEDLTIHLYKYKKNDKKLYATKQISWSTITQGKPIETWYPLVDKKERDVEEEIRLGLSHQEIVVRPKSEYDKIFSLLFDDEMEILTVLGLNEAVVPKERMTIAELLCNTSVCYKRDVQLISHLLTTEILACNDEAVLFRGNSVGTKILDYYFKLMGQNMLKLMLPLINSIHSDDKRTEISQTKLEPTDNLEENLARLQAYLNDAISIILGPETATLCPNSIRQILHHMQEAAKERFPNSNAIYTALSGFVFLRFFVPALLTPKLFGLSNVLFEGNANRTCTLVASVLQKMGNLQEFEPREAHFDKLNPFVRNKTPKVKELLDSWATGEGGPGNPSLEIDLYLNLAKLLSFFKSYRHLYDPILEDKSHKSNASFTEFFEQLDTIQKAIDTNPKPPLQVTRKVIEQRYEPVEASGLTITRKKLQRTLSANVKKGHMIYQPLIDEKDKLFSKDKDKGSSSDSKRASDPAPSPPSLRRVPTLRPSSGGKTKVHSSEALSSSKSVDLPTPPPAVSAPPPPPEPPKPRILVIHFPKNSKEEIPLADYPEDTKLLTLLAELCKPRDMMVQDYIAEDMSGKRLSLRGLLIGDAPKDEFCFLRQRRKDPPVAPRTHSSPPAPQTAQQMEETNALINDLLQGTTSGSPTTSGKAAPMRTASLGAIPGQGFQRDANMQGNMNVNMMGTMPGMGPWMGMGANAYGGPQMGMGMYPYMGMPGYGMMPGMGMGMGMMPPGMAAMNQQTRTDSICGECRLEINPTDSGTVRAQFKPERFFHQACFKCSRCKKPLSPTNHYILGNKFLTCGACYQNLVVQFNAAQKI